MQDRRDLEGFSMSSQPNSNDEHDSRAQHCGGRIGYHIHDLGSVND